MAKTGKNDFQLVLQKAENATVEWGSDIIVPCHLSPEISAVDMEIRWFKETDCVCLYKSRQMFEGRGYKGRVCLFTKELDRGNVSLKLRDFTRSDVGDYLCQVTSTDRTEEITVRVGFSQGDFWNRNTLVGAGAAAAAAAGAAAAGAAAAVGAVALAVAVGAAAPAAAAAVAVAAAAAAAAAGVGEGAAAAVAGATRAVAGAAVHLLMPKIKNILTIDKIHKTWSEEDRGQIKESSLLAGGVSV
ncbi:uncharacterized protein [Garra rufa]|uniref:uncharacterized protein isoform X2 n=1 Tax=Garra rufa TaxID=137080 RepID=UPI003CCE7863